MRRLLIAGVVALIVGGALGTLMARDAGYVLVTYSGMSLETSLWFAVLALLIGYFALRAVFWIATRIVRGGSGLAAWQQNRRARAAQARTLKGLLLLGEGDWVGARKALVADAEQLDAPWVNYVGAARAANETGDSSDRDALLDKAQARTSGSSLATALTRAELQIAAQQHQAALSTLLAARQDAPNHTRVLRLLTTCYEALRDWDALLKLAPELQRRGVLGNDARAYLLRWALGALEQPATGSTGDFVRRLADRWIAIDQNLRNDPHVVTAYVDALCRVGATAEAETVLSKAIAREWNTDLVSLYGRLQGVAGDQRRRTAEGWLKTRPNDPALLLALGRIALGEQQWAVAREYFEASLKQQRSADAYGELGRLCLALGERPRATELLAQAVELSGRLPQVALPRTE